MDESTSGSGSGAPISDLEAMMEELGLKEDEVEDVVVEDEEVPEEMTH